MGNSQSQSPQSQSGNVRSYDIESWSAGDKLAQDYLKDVKFDSVAVWARPLTNKAGIETGNQGLMFVQDVCFAFMFVHDVCFAFMFVQDVFLRIS